MEKDLLFLHPHTEAQACRTRVRTDPRSLGKFTFLDGVCQSGQMERPRRTGKERLSAEPHNRGLGWTSDRLQALGVSSDREVGTGA